MFICMEGLGVKKSLGGRIRQRARQRVLKEAVRRARQEKAVERKREVSVTSQYCMEPRYKRYNCITYTHNTLTQARKRAESPPSDGGSDGVDDMNNVEEEGEREEGEGEEEASPLITDVGFTDDNDAWLKPIKKSKSSTKTHKKKKERTSKKAALSVNGDSDFDRG